MIVRLMVLMICGGLAYAMLQGWPDTMPGLVRGCVAVLLLLAGLSWWAVGAKPEKVPLAKGHRKPGWLDFGAIGMGLLALECGFLWVFSVAPEPLENMAIIVEQRFSPEAAQRRMEQEGEFAVGGNWLWQGDQRRSLPVRTNLKPGMKPEVFIRLARREEAKGLLEDQVYVRAFTLDRYDDGVWSSASNGETELVSGEDGWVRFGDGNQNGILHEVFHGNDERGRNVLVALQGAVAVRLPSVEKSGEDTYILPAANDAGGYEYLASSQPLALEDLEGSDVSLYLARDHVSDPRIKELATRAAGNGTSMEKLRNVERFFRDRYGYSLTTRNPRNLDPLENFLFHERRGHCEFFATAAALAVRELGFESRVAYGWAGGQFFEINNTFVFRAREAHSWVEVRIKDYGWVVMEPTPPVVLGENGRPSRAGADTDFPDSEEFLDDFDEVVVSEAETIRMVSLGLAGFFALGAVVVILMRRTAKSDLTGSRVFGGKREGGYLSAWKKAVAERGIRQRGRTVRMQVDGLEDRPSFAERLTEYHYGVRYEGKDLDKRTEDGLEREILDWKVGEEFNEEIR